MRSLNDAYLQAQEHPSAETLEPEGKIPGYVSGAGRPGKEVWCKARIRFSKWCRSWIILAGPRNASASEGQRLSSNKETMTTRHPQKQRRPRISSMSGRRPATAATISSSVKPIWSTPTTKKAPTISSPALACGPSGYPTPATIWPIFISIKTSRTHRPAWKDSPPAIGKASLPSTPCTTRPRSGRPSPA